MPDIIICQRIVSASNNATLQYFLSQSWGEDNAASDNHPSWRSGVLASTFFIAGARAPAHAYTFTTINNLGDTAFNQLLGINNAGTIAGYFGDGTVIPNNGYLLAPPYGPANYTPENVPGAFQTQVTGLNNTGTTVGFWADTAGDNLDFINLERLSPPSTIQALRRPGQ